MFKPRRIMRWLALIGLTIMLVLLLSACGPAATEAPAPEEPVAEEPAAEEPTAEEPAAEPKTLIVAVAALPVTVDPNFAPGQESVEVIWNTYEPLFKYGLVDGPGGIKLSDTSGEGAMEAGLVESWEVSDDGTVYTFKLREGVLSPFGNELTAECAKWTFDREFGTAAIGAYIMGVATIPTPESVEVIDQYTFQITIPSPNPIFLRVMNVHTNFPEDCVEVQKHTTDDDPWATEWRDRNTAGFGPYMIESWTPGDQLVLAANPNWHGPPINIERIIYKEVPESSNRLALLLAGEVDIAESLTQRQLQEVEAKAGQKVISLSTNQFLWVAMQTREGPMADPLVRQALLYAMPYSDVQGSVYFGKATQAYGTVPDNYPNFFGDELWHYETDIDKAQELLVEAGLADGFEASILINADVAEQEEIAVLMKDAFAAIGVDLTIDKRPAAAYTDQKFSGDIELNLDQSYALVLDVGYHMATYFGPLSPLNNMGWANTEFLELLDLVVAEPESAGRSERLRRMQEIVIEEAPHIFVAQVPTAYGMQDGVTGYVWYTHNQLRFDDFDIAR